MPLKKELGLLDVFCISTGAMISSGLFILPAMAYAATGSAVIIAYIIAGLLILPTVLSKAELVTAMPKTGGIFFFTDRSMGPLAGTIGGFSAWTSLAFKSAFALLGMGIFLYLLNPGLDEIYVKLVAVGLCLVFMTLNILGVKLASKVQVFLVLTLIGLLVIYILAGLFFVDSSNYTPFMHKEASWTAIPATAGLVFISYAGTTKTAAVAGEVKNPGRNLPIGMLLAWGVTTVLYIAVISVTIGLLKHEDFAGTLTPISLGGGVIVPTAGLIIMSIAGILAFVTTGNGGIMAASRDPMAMGTDGHLPKVFSKMSKSGTPWVAIVVTTGVMICIVFLPLETFVKTASTLKLMLFIMANVAIIFMREANMPHYRPKYRAPLYPYIQAIAIIAYSYLIFQMIIWPLFDIGGIGDHDWNKSASVVGFTLGFILLAFIWYFFFVRGKTKRQSALFHVVKRINGIRHTNLLDGELRSILAERDNVTERRFDRILKKAKVLPWKEQVRPGPRPHKEGRHVHKGLRPGPCNLHRGLLPGREVLLPQLPDVAPPGQ
jgi:amino acid transporter